MRLAELAATQPFAGPLAAPQWTLGCFSRRCITYATGVEDTSTTVIWVQSHGLTGDIRVPKGRTGDDAPEYLARGEGFVAQTSWRDDHMHWDAFAAFQPYEKWPEPGRLERVGACLIEWAPSGTYVEDWRMLPGCDGLSVGLRLISETGADGIERPREGGLVIAGDHAILVLDRREPIGEGRAHELIVAGADPCKVFDAVVAYAVKGEVVLAVDPALEGGPMFTDDFKPGDVGELIQREGHVARRWKIDTLLAGQTRSVATSATEAGLAWLAAESGTLLA